MPDILPNLPRSFDPPDNLAELESLGMVMNIDVATALNVGAEV